MAGEKYYYGLGRRKSAIAKVRIYESKKPEFIINNKPAIEYLADMRQMAKIFDSLKLVGKEKNFRMVAMVNGGGISAQTEAIRLGISKALLDFEPNMRKTLKEHGYLTRDPRAKERKKPGLRRARRAPQFSKR